MMDFDVDPAVARDRRATGGSLLVDLQIRLGVAGGNAGAGKIRRYDIPGLLPPIMKADSKVSGDLVDVVISVAGQEVVGLGGVDAQIVEFAFRSRSGHHRCDGVAGWAFLDIPGQIQ